MGAIHPLDSKKITQNDIMTAISIEIQAKFRKSRFFITDKNHPSAVWEHAHAAASVGCVDTLRATLPSASPRLAPSSAQISHGVIAQDPRQRQV